MKSNIRDKFETFVSSKSYDEAVKLIDNIDIGKQTDLNLLEKLSLTYNQTGRNELALKAIERIIQLEPNQSGQSHVSTQDGSGIEVSNLTLDDYCGQQMLDSVDFAKIDLEGHELPALQGWNKCLSKHRVKAIYLEIMPENQTRYGRQTKAPLCYLESLGYELYLCKEEDFGLFGNVPAKVSLQQGNFLLSRFKTEEYPEDFATDILALPPT